MRTSVLPQLTLCVALLLSGVVSATQPAAPEELAATLGAGHLDAATVQAGRNLLDEGVAEMQARQVAEAALVVARTDLANGPSR